METFKRIVRYVASNSCMFQYPLRNGLDSFVSGVDYVIEDKEDFLRLMSGDAFVDVTPVPKTKEKPVEEEVVTEEVTPKNKREFSK